MFIQNIFLNRNNQYNQNEILISSRSAHPLFGSKADILTREIKLKPEELKKVSYIADVYERILSIFNQFNGIYQKKFKSTYSKLVTERKAKGFIFKTIEGLKDKRIQIVRFNTKPNSDELLTFGVLDSQNKNLLRYRINKQGKVLISTEKDNVSRLSSNPFDDKSKVGYEPYLHYLTDEMEEFRFYAENFKTINRKVNIQKTESEVSETILKVKALGESKGLKPEISEIVESYSKVSDALNLKGGKDAFELKQAYIGNVSEKAKGLSFRNIGVEKRTLSYCPLQSKDDNRVCRIVVQDKNGNLENAFVFFTDGRVAKQKKRSLDTNDFRVNNLEFISDKEIEDFGIKEIFITLNNKFSEFKDFITKYREEKSLLKLRNIEKKKAQISAKREELKELKKARKLAKNAEREANKDEVQRMKIELKNRTAEERKIQKQKEAELKEVKRLEKLKVKQQAAEVLEQRKIQKEHIQKVKLRLQDRVEKTQSARKYQKAYTNLKKFNKNIEDSKKNTIPNYREMWLWKVTDNLNKLFNTPVEDRSSHLIHEKLGSGKIFAGRVFMKASDDAYITVSRVKSPKYVDFTYYSIKVQKDGNEFVFNLDPEFDKILLSKDGKPVINAKARVSYITKEDYLKQNPEAVNLPKYLSELFAINEYGPKQVIDSSLKMKKRIELQHEKELDVAEALIKPQDYIPD